MNFLKNILVILLSICSLSSNLQACCFENTPRSSINSGLDNPVSIDFSRSCFAVANQDDDTVSIYGFEQAKCIVSNTPITTLTTTTGGINTPTVIKFSPNGKCLAVINSGNNKVDFYQARSNCIFNPIATSSIDISNPISLAFSADAQCIAIGSSDNRVSIFPFNQILCLIDQSPTTTITDDINIPISLEYSNLSTCFGVLNQGSNTFNLYKAGDSECTLNTEPGEIQIINISPFANRFRFSPSDENNSAIAISAGNNAANSNVSFYAFDAENCTVDETPTTVLDSSNGINLPVDINFSPNTACFLTANAGNNNIQIRAFDINNATIAVEPTVTLTINSPIKALFSQNNRCIGASSKQNSVNFFGFIVRSSMSKSIQPKYCNGC